MKYDVVIVGGGAAGCVLAGRLASNAQTSVLLLEAGSDYADPAHLPDEIKLGHTRFAEAPLAVIPLRLNRYSDFFRRAAQYFFIRRLTARRAAADIFRRARRARAGLPPWRLRPSLPSKALIAWVSLTTSRSRADRSERSC